MIIKCSVDLLFFRIIALRRLGDDLLTCAHKTPRAGTAGNRRCPNSHFTVERSTDAPTSIIIVEGMDTQSIDRPITFIAIISLLKQKVIKLYLIIVRLIDHLLFQ